MSHTRNVHHVYITLLMFSLFFLDQPWHAGSALIKEIKDHLFLNTKPLSYQLQIDPDLQESVFRGIVTIHIKVIYKTNEILLNSDHLHIRQVTVTTIGESRKSIKLEFSTNLKNLLVIRLKQWLPVDSQYEITIQYTGRMYQNNPFGLGRHGTYFAGSKYT